MTEESEGSKGAPGSGAGDAAPTQAIPRMPKPAADKPAAAKKAPPAKKAPAKPATKSAADTQTDKGRPRPTAATPAGGPDEKDADTGSDAADTGTAAKKRQIKPVTGPTGRPLTAADYARTTQGSPSATSVIPAVKDDRNEEPASSQVMAGEAASRGGSGRRASLRLTHVEPWSVTRLAFAISVAMMIVAVVAVTIFWVVLDIVGVWDQINESFTTVLADDSSSFNVTDYFGLGRVVGLSLVLSAVNVVLTTALATIAAHLYNLAAQLMGGVEVTLAEER